MRICVPNSSFEHWHQYNSIHAPSVYIKMLEVLGWVGGFNCSRIMGNAAVRLASQCKELASPSEFADLPMANYLSAYGLSFIWDASTSRP
jgi:hypothetical protein